MGAFAAAIHANAGNKKPRRIILRGFFVRIVFSDLMVCYLFRLLRIYIVLAVCFYAAVLDGGFGVGTVCGKGCLYAVFITLGACRKG